jgi:hypothetical protein
MMEIGCIQGATRFLGAPKDWDKSKGHCGTLPIRDMPTDIGNAMVSAWLPNRDEIVALACGGPLYLHIYGVTHPVVGLSVGEPPADADPILEPTLMAVQRVLAENGIEATHTVASKIAMAAVFALHQAMEAHDVPRPT